MVFSQFLSKRTMLAVVAVGMLSSCVHKKYDNPITKVTEQPDKVLFDKAMKDIEHGRYEIARISLNTLMNTYESSEFLAKAKLAIADSWFREGGLNGLAQAEAEYKDFKLFYPSMPEAAEAQNRVCQIHFRQMEKSDRDESQSLRAEDECRQLLVEFPNSKFAPEAAQTLRNIQESLGEHEFKVGQYYWQKGSNPAAANRLLAIADQYPLYSKSDEALFEAGDSYSRMGPRFRQKSGELFSRMIQFYPLSVRADEAKARLQEMEMPLPQSDRAAMDRMKWEQENFRSPSMMSKGMGFLRRGPDVSHAARSGQPAMANMKPTIPASVPLPTTVASAGDTNGTGGGTTDVGVATTGDANQINQGQDARANGGKPAAAVGADGKTPASQTAPTQAEAQGMPSNHDADIKRARERQAKASKKGQKRNKKDSKQGQPAATKDGGVKTDEPTTPAETAQPTAPTQAVPNPNPASPNSTGPGLSNPGTSVPNQ